jgi:Domain of unknown function (DUF4062)
MSKLRVFVSSVQKELENERLAVLSLISTDAFLQVHCEPVLYKFEPASPKKAVEECLTLVGTCDIYLTVIWREYGYAIDDVSITRQEYRLARSKPLPILAFIKGDAGIQREPGTADFIKEIGKDGLKYKRFGNLLELLKEVRVPLVKILKERFAIEPSSDENEVAEQTLKANSDFEVQALKRLRWEDLDHETARRMVASAEQRDAREFSPDDLLHNLITRDLIWNDADAGIHFATAAGIVLLARDPSVVFPHCRILADAYRGAEPGGDPMDQTDFREPMPLAIEKAIAFVERNTRHPIRIIGLTCWGQDGTQAAVLRLTAEAKKTAIAEFTDYGDQHFSWFWKTGHDWIPDLDNGGSGMITLQLMLMQCDGKRIQLLPAWPKDWTADFKLHAPHQTTVEGHVENGRGHEFESCPRISRQGCGAGGPMIKTLYK